MLEPADDRTTPPSAAHDAPRGWLDTPWPWFGLFAVMGLAFLLAIAPKYAQRQGRLERRYENRVQIEERRLGSSTDSAAPVLMRDARAQTSLVPLAVVLLGLLVAVWIGGMVWLRRRAEVHTDRPSV